MKGRMAIGTQGKLGAGGWLAVASAGLALAIGVEDGHAAFPGANGRIAFAVEQWRPPAQCLPVRYGCEPELVSSRIETVLASGRGRRVLYEFSGGQGLASDSGPAWSPSGMSLAFQQGGRLAIIRHDGTRLRRLRQLTDRDREPAWSPDGRRLAFVGDQPCLYCSWLYTVRSDGTALRRVIDQGARWPAWSATGSIAFVNYDDQYQRSVGVEDGLYTIRPDGSRLRRVFRRYWGTGQQPDWSPDGRRVAFGARDHIFTLGAAGRGLRRLTALKSHRTPSSDPVWSPNGKHIAFIRDDDLYVMRSNGGGLRRVVDAPDPDPTDPDRAWAEVSVPTWQPRLR
jgi:Tol biopolymer transport system component